MIARDENAKEGIKSYRLDPKTLQVIRVRDKNAKVNFRTDRGGFWNEADCLRRSIFQERSGATE